MCGGVHYGEVEGLVSVERWSCSRGGSCEVQQCGDVNRGVWWSLCRGTLTKPALYTSCHMFQGL